MRSWHLNEDRKDLWVSVPGRGSTVQRPGGRIEPGVLGKRQGGGVRAGWTLESTVRTWAFLWLRWRL